MRAVITEHDVEQGSPEWHALREPLYTGANADRLLRFGQIDYSRNPDAAFGGNFYTKRGHLLEAKAIALYERIQQCSVRSVGFVTNSLYPQCGYSPDGLLPEILIEVKCFNKSLHLKMWKATKPAEILALIPFKVLAQVHYGMFITGRKVAHLLIYNPEFAKRTLPDGSPNPDYDPKKAFKIITIRRESAIAANLKRILKPKEPRNVALHPQAA